MPILATTWWPSSDPIGPASVTALLVASVCWVLAEVSELEPAFRDSLPKTEMGDGKWEESGRTVRARERWVRKHVTA